MPSDPTNLTPEAWQRIVSELRSEELLLPIANPPEGFTARTALESMQMQRLRQAESVLSPLPVDRQALARTLQELTVREALRNIVPHAAQVVQEFLMEPLIPQRPLVARIEGERAEQVWFEIVDLDLHASRRMDEEDWAKLEPLLDAGEQSSYAAGEVVWIEEMLIKYLTPPEDEGIHRNPYYSAS